MKRALIILIAVFGVSLSSIACDLCGCYMGVLPKYDKNFIGYRMRYRSFSGYMFHDHTGTMDHTGLTPPYSSERFFTFDLMAKYYINSRWNVNLIAPFSINTSIDGDEKNTISGIGDPALLAMYRAVKSEDNDCGKLQQNLFLGGGIKLPIGSFNKPFEDGDIEPHAQPGTGSFDFVLASTYLLHYKNFGLSAEGTYKFNTANTVGFRYGNRFNTSVNFIYWKKTDKLLLLPQIGTYIESAPADKISGADYINTGGTVAFGSAAVDIHFKKISVNITGQLPVYQHLPGMQLPNKARIITGINYYF